MTLILGLALGGAALLAILWWPVLRDLHDVLVYGLPARVDRHPHMTAMDELADPIRLHDCGRFHRSTERCPRRRCEWCGAELDALGSCCGPCAGEPWDRPA